MFKTILQIFVVLLILMGVGCLHKMRYDECRAHGFSVFYCMSGK